MVHTFNGAQGRFAIWDEPLGAWVTEAKGSCLIRPDMRVRIIQETPLEFIALGIEPALFEKVAQGMSDQWSGIGDIFKTMDPALVVLFAEMRRSILAEPIGAGDYLDSLTHAVLSRLITWHQTPVSDEKHGAETLAPSVAKRLVQRIDEQLDRPIKIANLAEEVGLSRSYFSRAFSQTFGMSAQNYVISRRISCARNLLTETSQSLTEISYQCGFSNPSHFTTAFKDELGLTPSDYRKVFQDPV